MLDQTLDYPMLLWYCGLTDLNTPSRAGAYALGSELDHADAQDGWRRVLRNDFLSGVIWNLGSVVILATAGFVLTVLAGRYYGQAGLGVFNQIYALIIVIGQLSVMGVQFSTLKHVAEVTDDIERSRQVVWSAVVLVLLASSVASIGAFTCADLIGQLLGSVDVGKGLLWAATGIVFFSLNKVFLAALNGLNHMRAFAVGQAARPILMVVCLGFILVLGLPVHALGALFVVPELLLFLCLLPLVAYRLPISRVSINRTWISKHVSFGLRAFVSGFNLELNSRVAVVILGFFLSDSEVGIFCLAAVFAEGVLSLLLAVRNNVNPYLAVMLRDKCIEGVKAMRVRIQRVVYPVTLAAALLLLLLYRPLVALLFPDQAFDGSWPVLMILLAGISFASGFLPFEMIHVQAGRPGLYTLLTTWNLSTNIVLNLAFVPLWGIYGSAAATAISLGLSVVALCFAVRKWLRFAL